MSYVNLTLTGKILRTLWNVVWLVLCRFTPVFAHKWRILILRGFGAEVDFSCFVYPDVKVWAPWNLSMSEDSTLAFGVVCYNPGKVFLGKHSIVSQHTHICTAGHDYEHPDALKGCRFPLLVGDIRIGDHVWVTADCFVGPGVTLGDWSVVLPRSVVVKDVESHWVVAGVPAKFIKNREIRKIG